MAESSAVTPDRWFYGPPYSLNAFKTGVVVLDSPPHTSSILVLGLEFNFFQGIMNLTPLLSYRKTISA